MFSETQREHAKDQWTPGRQASLHKHCLMVIPAHTRGTEFLVGQISSVTRVERGLAEGMATKKSLHRSSLVLKGREEQFSTGSFHPTNSWSSWIESLHVGTLHTLSYSHSKKAT